MNSLIFCWFFVVIVNITEAFETKGITITDKQYGSMPPIFKADDFDRCLQQEERPLYCQIKYELEPLDPKNPPEVWNTITVLNDDPKFYRHDWLRHGLCLHQTCPNISKEEYQPGNNIPHLMKSIQDCYNGIYKHEGLTGSVTEISCQGHERNREIDTFDMIVALLIFVYFSFVIAASFYEGFARYKSPKEYKEQIEGSYFGNLMSYFSIVKNWELLRKKTSNEFTDQLQSFQGTRVICMCIVISAHALIIYYYVGITNPLFIEQLLDQPFYQFLASGAIIMQVFFMISGWLVAAFFFRETEEFRRVPFKFVIIATINRYFRILPVLVFVYLFTSTWMAHIVKGPYWQRSLGVEVDNCRDHGWLNFLNVQNYVNKENMCMEQTWYLAVDQQLFCIGIVFVWLMRNFQNIALKIISTAIAVTTLIPMVLNYYFDFDIVVRYTPERVYEIMLQTPHFHVMYTAGYNNITAYLIGIAAGYIYYKYRNENLLSNKLISAMVYVFARMVFFGYFYYGKTLYDNYYQNTRWWAALYVGISKTIFIIAVAMVFYGYTQKIGYMTRKLLEWDALQVFGRISFCVYMVHVALLRLRATFGRTPYYVEEYPILHDVLGDIFIACFWGTLVCLTIEMPFTRIQKTIMNRFIEKDKQEKLKSTVKTDTQVPEEKK